MRRKLTVADLVIAKAFQAWRRKPGEDWCKYGPLMSRRDCLTAVVEARRLHPGVRFCVRRRGILPREEGTALDCY